MADQIDSIIKLRRGPDSERRQITFDQGEIVFSTDTRHTFIGDGRHEGGSLVGNLNYIGSTPSPSAVFGDFYFDQINCILYLLSSDVGPDNIVNYAKITPSIDSSLVFRNGKYGINTDYFSNSATGYVHLSGDKMTGFLTLCTNPTQDFHAATKVYVDTKVSGLATDAGSTYVKKSGDIMSGNLVVNAALNVSTSAGFSGEVDFQNNYIEKFKVKVYSGITLDNTNNYTYTLDIQNNGAVLCIGTSDASFVNLPPNLPVGYNALVVNMSKNTISFTSDTGVAVLNVYNYRNLSQRYGVCNLVVIAPNTFLISGDLSS